MRFLWCFNQIDHEKSKNRCHDISEYIIKAPKTKTKDRVNIFGFWILKYRF